MEEALEAGYPTRNASPSSLSLSLLLFSFSRDGRVSLWQRGSESGWWSVWELPFRDNVLERVRRKTRKHEVCERGINFSAIIAEIWTDKDRGKKASRFNEFDEIPASD